MLEIWQATAQPVEELAVLSAARTKIIATEEAVES
jgi:hypothetical protein